MRNFFTNHEEAEEHFEELQNLENIVRKMKPKARQTCINEIIILNRIFIGLLSISHRKEMLEALMKQYGIFGIDYNFLAEKMPGFTANDVAAMTKTVLECAKMQGKNYDDVSTKDFEAVFLKMTPSLLKTSKFCLKVKPIYWKDIGGMKSIKQRLQLCIEKPLINPEIFKKVDLPIPRGVLLFGPPGCCKTTIARGLATECKANFFAANPSQIYSPYVGESEKNISELFFEARLCAPSIIFLDEIDCIVGRREFGSKVVGVAEKVLSTLLTEMDGFGVSTVYGGCEDPHKVLSYCASDETEDCEERISDQVIVVGATNRPDLIDDALLRPGRFDMILYVPPPNAEERESILRTFTDVPLLNVDLKLIAEKSEHLSGADLTHLYRTAVTIALRQNESTEYITEEHFMKALEIVKPSITLEQIKMYEKLASRYGTFIR
nr:spermatogenesis-associated protein 5-like protein 1 isoform X2 [Parasteatoda tepidariorum]